MATNPEDLSVSAEIQNVVKQQTEDKNDAATVEKSEAAVEAGSVEDEPKSYYSKLSVWLMVLFSGLAIGSDG